MIVAVRLATNGDCETDARTADTQSFGEKRDVMNPSSPLPLLVGLLLLAGAVWLRPGRRILRGRKRDFVEFAVNHRQFLRGRGLTDASHFLALDGMVVSGHANRNVMRLALGDGMNGMTVYLKREQRVPWSVRFGSLVAGFGFVSRSVREARSLQALRREGLSAPEWLATGEDGRGNAFLLVRGVDRAVELRDFLRTESDPTRRRRAARTLGRELARLHDAGFAHPDLYAKHVMIAPEGEAVTFLDWQRSWRGRRLGWSSRLRDLAALHATLADELATAGERLACLHAYLPRRPRTAAKRKPRRGLLRWLQAAIEARAARLRRRRHIAEKGLPAPPAEPQEWLCVEGQELCVTPGFEAQWPDRAPAWLSLDRQPAPTQHGLYRRWLATAGAPRALLVRRRGWPDLAVLWAWLRGRPPASPEQRQAALLFRLQRHAVPAPRVLAMGQRHVLPWHMDSFLLTVPDAGAIRLGQWLTRQYGPAAPAATARRRRLLREAGVLLHRLHSASCYLGEAASDALAVRTDVREPTMVLSHPEFVVARRKPDAGRARRDLAVFERHLVAVGCSRTDVRRMRLGYEGDPREVVRSYRTNVPPPKPRVFAHLQGTSAMASPPGNGAAVEPPRRDGLLRRLIVGARRLRERPTWIRHVGPGWADGIMDVAVTDRFHAKQGRSTGRWILPARDGANEKPLIVYLKRHYELAWWQRLLATIWPRGGWSPALQEWRHLEWARAQGVPVPEALAAAEFIGPWGRLRSFLAVKELTDMLPLHEAIPLAADRLAPAAFHLWKRALAAEMARLARLLHDRHCFHKDLYLCHFYIARADTAVVPAGADSWRGRVYLIDLHRLTHHPLTARMWQMKDLAQLLYSSEIAGVDARDRLSFWKAYHGTGPRRTLDRWLRSWVLFKWRRYRRHNARRKARVEAAKLRQAG